MTASYWRRYSANRDHGLQRPKSRVGVGSTASREPSVTHGGMIRRSVSSSAPSAPKMARRMMFSVIRIIGSRVSNSEPSGHDATSRSVSSSTMAS